MNYYYVFEFKMIVIASLQQRVVYVNRVTAEINPGTEGQIFIRLATDFSTFESHYVEFFLQLIIWFGEEENNIVFNLQILIISRNWI
jgi:hypothetical protein